MDIRSRHSRSKSRCPTQRCCLNGSIGGAAMDNVLKICNALSVRIEDLEQISETGTLTGRRWKEEAADVDEHLMKLVRDLPPDKKIALKILLTNL